MDKEHILLLKFLYENKDKYISEDDLPDDIAAQLPFDGEHLYQLSTKKLADEHPKQKSSYKINATGIKLIEPILESEKRRDLIERLEFGKLQDEVYNLKLLLEDYDTVKKYNKASVIIALISAMIAAIALWKQH